MQRAQARGCRLVIAWLTDGGASHGALVPEQRENLVSRRRGEAMEGIRALGVAPVAMYHLGYPDGTLAQHTVQARRDIEDICVRHAICTVVVTDVCDNHPDHRAAYTIAAELAGCVQLLTYPVSARFDGGNYVAPAEAVWIASGQDTTKRAALLQHGSQMEAGAICPMTDATIDRFCADAEYFIPVDGTTA